MSREHQMSSVVYNLYELLPGLYSANAFFVRRDGNGELTHILQKAGTHLLDAFGIEEPLMHLRLLRIVEQIQPKALEQYFNGKKKKPQPLESLYEDEQIKGQMQQYVHRRLDELLSLIQKHGLPLSWDAERRSLVKDMLLNFGDLPLQPLLAFKRMPEGVSYRLKLADANGPWEIHTRDVIPVTNLPAWVIADYHICRVAHINGKMVLPFQKKNEVRIPKASVKKYFQQFILKVAAKVDIEAEGFEVIQHHALLGCRLEPLHDLFGGHWTLAAYMIYQGSEFPCFDRRQERTSLEFGNGEDIRIVKVKRDNTREKGYVDILKAMGLEPGNGSHFASLSDDPLHLLQWLCMHRHALEREGFTIIAPETDQGRLLLHEPSLNWNTRTGNDWFDLYGEIRVGERMVTFMELAPYIREGNRFFPLPDGAVFLIPAEWMSRYKGLAQMGKRHEGGMRLLKSQLPLLRELAIPDLGEEPTEDKPAPVTIPAALNATLRPYQLEGYYWLAYLYRQGLGACLADDMGLGKTLQTITMLLYAKSEKSGTPATGAQLSLFQQAADADFLKPLHALVVMPASLVFNWQRELRQFAPVLTVCIHTGPGRHKDTRLLARFDVTLTTYQTALRDRDLLAAMEWEYVVLDESQ